jgi:hypothetical protein
VTARPKIGTKRYTALVWEGKVEIYVHVLRTIRGRYGYMIQHIHGLTWIKKSKKHGDWGYADNMPEYRTKFPLSSGLPYSPTKLSALRDALKWTKVFAKEDGLDELTEVGDGAQTTYREEIKILETAIKREQTRLRKSKEKQA